MRRPSLIARQRKQPDDDVAPWVFVLDENLGTTILANHLRGAGLEVLTFTDLDMRGEQDPWAFYWCGKNQFCLISSDKDFLGRFTHMAAIRLGKTRVFAFTGGNENMNKRGKAFVAAKPKILRILKKQPEPFVVSVGLNGDVKILDERPMPTRKRCLPAHWESYLRVCRAEGVEVHDEAYTVPGSDHIRPERKEGSL